MRNRSFWYSIDWLTIIIYLTLVMIGWLIIYATDYDPANQSLFSMKENYGRQFIWIGISLLAGASILLFETKFFTTFAYVVYFILLGILVLTLFIAPEIKGSKSWIEIGSFRLQPSEFAKFATALALAKYVAKLNVDMRKVKDQLVAFLLIILPAGLIIMQGDAGSALIYGGFVLVMFREGMHARYLTMGGFLVLISVLALAVNKYFVIGGLFVLAGLFSWIFYKKNKKIIGFSILFAVLFSGYIMGVDFAFNNFLQQHQQTRIMVLLGQETDMKGAGYNVMQSKIAIGSGGFWGKGFLNGTQTQFNFVPEQSTDFIFCTIAEEHGFVGSFIIIALFAGLLIRIVHIAERQRSKFSRVYAYGTASIIFMHLLINIGMTIGLAPVIGIPLPFISYGGSSLMSFTILLFILLRLDADRLKVLR